MHSDLQLADLCVQSYTDKTHESKDVEFLHVESDDCHTFAIRGTEAQNFFDARGWIDVIRDLRVLPNQLGETYAHSGFSKGWEAIAPIIKKIHDDNPKQIVLCGHSMGGIIALCGGYSLVCKGLPVAKVVTFGAPRGIIPEPIDLHGYMSRLKQISKQYEIVTDKVPGFMKWTRYKHISTVFLEGDRRNSWLTRNYKDHWMGNYLRALGSSLFFNRKRSSAV